MSGHTAGPWEVVEHSWSDTSVAAGPITVCRLSIYDEATEDTQSALEARDSANARLIAAAPELLAALRDVLGWIPDGGPWHTDAPMKSVAAARAAITKATQDAP